MRAFVQRRELLLGLAALPVAARIAVAETYPSRAVRILVATSAGGGTDLVARFIAQWLTERLGQSFFVENRPGVGTHIRTAMSARAPRVGPLPHTTDDPVARLADVPPLAKAVPGYRADAWSGLCAPRGTPSEIITLLNKEVNLAMADPKIKERIASLGGVALPGSPEDYGRTIATDTEKWAKVVQFSGAHVN